MTISPEQNEPLDGMAAPSDTTPDPALTPEQLHQVAGGQAYPTNVYTNQYDGVADFPQYPLQPVTDLSQLTGHPLP